MQTKPKPQEDSLPVRDPGPAASPPAAGGRDPRRPPGRGRSRTSAQRAAGLEGASPREVTDDNTDLLHSVQGSLEGRTNLLG